MGLSFLLGADFLELYRENRAQVQGSTNLKPANENSQPALSHRRKLGSHATTVTPSLLNFIPSLTRSNSGS
jgi:hypothetical protein